MNNTCALQGGLKSPKMVSDNTPVSGLCALQQLDLSLNNLATLCFISFSMFCCSAWHPVYFYLLCVLQAEADCGWGCGLYVPPDGQRKTGGANSQAYTSHLVSLQEKQWALHHKQGELQMTWFRLVTWTSCHLLPPSTERDDFLFPSESLPSAWCVR